MRWSQILIRRLPRHMGCFRALDSKAATIAPAGLVLLMGAVLVLFVALLQVCRPQAALAAEESEATATDSAAAAESTDEAASQSAGSEARPASHGESPPRSSAPRAGDPADGTDTAHNRSTDRGQRKDNEAQDEPQQKPRQNNKKAPSHAASDNAPRQEAGKPGQSAASASASAKTSKGPEGTGADRRAKDKPATVTVAETAAKPPTDDGTVGVSDAGVSAPVPRAMPAGALDAARARPITTSQATADAASSRPSTQAASPAGAGPSEVMPAAAHTPVEGEAIGKAEQSDEAGRDKPAATDGAAQPQTALERLVAEGPGPFEVQVEPAVFRNVRPGETTAAELEKQWGPPLEIHRQDGLVQYVYELERFPSVSVTLVDGQVASLLVELEASQPPETLIDRLRLAAVRLVRVTDVEGNSLGLAFPERGVLFSFDPRSEEPRVSQVVLETIDPQSFVLRARLEQEHHPTDSLRDVEYALQLDADLAEAHWIRARLLERLGRYPEGLEAIETAIRLEPKRLRFRLTRAKILDRTGQSVQAIAETKATVDLCKDDARHIKAEALLQLGDLLASGPGRDFKAAIDHHIEAIRLAEPLADDRRAEVRASVRQTAVLAYLATATDVAWGSWRRKDEVAKKWLERAEDRIDRFFADAPREADRFRFAWATTALAADVGLRGQWDPAPWIDKVRQLGKARLKQADDDLLRQAEVEWELGLALYDALQVAQLRGQTEDALQLGQAAVDHLEAAVPIKRQMPGLAYMLGRLYFRIGAIYAAGGEAHDAATEWFDRAVPLLEEPVPVNAVGDVGRQGETFVSMAVSYWEVGQREESLRLTEQGLHLMQQAVEDGILDPEALAIPYHNLAQMHRQLGQPDKAEAYAQLAAKAENGQDESPSRAR